MKPIVFAATLIVASLSALADPDADEPDGPGLLQSVVNGLPSEPLSITGDLLVRKRRGVPVRELSLDINLNWGAHPPEAAYTIRDGFGRPLEYFHIQRPASGAPQVSFAVGPDLSPTNPPAAFAPVGDTDFTWTDLAMNFLWWPNAQRVGVDSIKGRDCYIVDVPVPDTVRQRDARYDHVRLWIDQEIRMLLQAEGRDAANNALRRMWVRSFKKINDRWMIKDMEVQAYPAQQRTKLTIREVEEVGQP